LTTRSCARSNTALFRIGSNGHAADLPTFEDTARTPSRFPGAQPHPRRAQGAAQPSRARPPPHRALGIARTARKRFGLDADRRLRQKAQFELLLRKGEKRSLGGYTFFFARRDAGQPRLGILISRKHAAAAADRNRIKRCIREAFRLEQEKLGPLDILVRPAYGPRASSHSVGRLRELLCRLSA
jgi:ribonuclease P protein component